MIAATIRCSGHPVSGCQKDAERGKQKPPDCRAQSLAGCKSTCHRGHLGAPPRRNRQGGQFCPDWTRLTTWSGKWGQFDCGKVPELENDRSLAHIGGMPREKITNSLLRCPCATEPAFAEMSDDKSF